MSSEKPQRRSDLLEKPLGDETLLYDADGGMIHVLNATAQAIWSLCDGEHTVESIVQTLATQFNFGGQQLDLRRDVVDTLATFSQKGLLSTGSELGAS